MDLKQSCRTCALWDRDAAKDKAGRIRNDRTARCLWASSEMRPISVAHHLYPLPKPGYTGAANGETCPCWRKWEDNHAET